MKVYISSVYMPHEDTEVLGVYSTQAKAQIESDKAKSKCDSKGYNKFSVDEWEIDGEMTEVDCG